MGLTKSAGRQGGASVTAGGSGQRAGGAGLTATLAPALRQCPRCKQATGHVPAGGQKLPA